MMKSKILTAAITFIAFGGFAQTLQEIITKTDNENFESAARDFKVLLARDPNKGDYYFYYGENFFKRGEGYLDSANAMYSKGVEVNATYPLNYVGLGKVLLAKGKTADAKTQFFKAQTLGANKNAEVFRKLAEAWLVTDIKSPDEAIVYANSAIKLDPKNPEGYILLGDAQLEKNPTDGSEPIKNYKKATSLNPKSVKGILREGNLYRRGRNWQLALDTYKQAESIDPNFAPAYREKAELYFNSNQSAKSIENWKKYLELNNSDFARYRYMSALQRNKQYVETIAEYENLKKVNYNSLYLERLAGYSYYEMGDKTDKDAFIKGLKAMDNFFQMAGPDFKYVGMDYKYKGLLMFKSAKEAEGIIELEKAISMDPTLAGDIYSEIANSSYKNKNYERAIIYYEKKAATDAKTMTNNDWFNFGRSYYYSGGAKQNEAAGIKDAKEKALKEEEAKPYYIKADSAFSNLVRLNPGWSTSYIWRGRTNAILDPKVEKEIAREMYEKCIGSIKPEEKTTTGKKDLTEALEYLGYYYVTKKDKVKSDEIFNQLKELDPNNQKAKDYFNPPKPVAPKTGTTKPGPAKPKGK